MGSFAIKMKKLVDICSYFLIFPVVPIVSLILFVFLLDGIFQDSVAAIIVFEFLVIAISILGEYYYFNWRTNRLHNIRNDDFLLDFTTLKREGQIIVAVFSEGVWSVDIQGRQLLFSLGSYPFEKSYIAAYFIRQFLYSEINAKAWMLGAMFEVYPIHSLIKKEMKEVFISFQKNGKEKKVCIVRDYKPKNILLKRWITRAPYYWTSVYKGRGSILGNRIKNLSEEKYWRYSK